MKKIIKKILLSLLSIANEEKDNKIRIAIILIFTILLIMIIISRGL